ncbi:pyridoxal phosphate biosynthetic protein PdxA [Neokomagataea thailandica NBRC 106555]|uniref:4-hydroxythreonine-4-phosphate dehydrogenase n=2 Tax=Neokomagataea TaxID=1223423 RepID=A0A4Y6V9I0_9PROT|nr:MULTISPECIES: 4-hydroxythreonine-4-phosphate dehydrogenase PdxA [Neokomagataea]QDH25578.1 4-hydroxythreonine-4-phosphate dehydrogenase PdxA [Neokomagataea tanensis]GBR52641.1 pyridoxal phosphate biosynthetic protein PdxA [Neokomagataea thailandica NBRC 106555]
MTKAPLALTLGDPAGIGPELTVSAWEILKNTEHCFFWLGDPTLLDGVIPTQLISAPEEAAGVFATALPVLPIYCPVTIVPGQPTPSNAPAVIESIRKAVELALTGSASGVVTNPIAKHILAESGFPHPGHTEFLAQLCSVSGQEIMMLASPELRVVPVSIHVSLQNAIHSLTAERIITVTRIANKALTQDFGLKNPKLAIAGLNPHAGESGLMGHEEHSIIIPAINALKEEGIDAQGPYPPDTMFAAHARTQYDAAICMYHDQGLIPLKTLDMTQGVNITLGLPIVRTSPDHGTAFDIAQPLSAPSKKADARSLVAAIRTASKMAHNRKEKAL